MLLVASSRPIRVIAWAGNFENWFLKSLGKLFGVILVNPAKPKSIVSALKEAREAVLAGDLVCIFPEGGISRSGQLLAFRPGMMRILEGTGIPAIPVFIDQLWGSIFSFAGGRFFWKWPQRIPYPLSIHFGKPMPSPDDVHRVRQAVQELGAIAVQQRSGGPCPLVSDFVRMCKRRKWSRKIADSTGAELTGGQLLMRTLIVRQLLRKQVLAPQEQYVGVLLPPSAGGFVVNMALAIDRRVSANLNYTNTAATLNACIAHAGIKHVITSRRFMEKMNIALDAEMVYLEDLAPKVSLIDKLCSALASYLVPGAWLVSSLGVNQIPGDEVMTVIFTSGSTGVPKGVMLMHGNVASNVAAIDQVVRLNSRDVLIGILPFFHSFGYTVTMWSVAGLDVSGVYHFNPLDAKIIGKLCKKYAGTVLLSTPTFLRGFIRRVEADEFATLDVVVAGAEKLPTDICDAFEAKFKVRPVEGYGTTELSPLVAVNVPPSRSSEINQIDRKEGTVGRPVPGVSAKVTDLETGVELPADTPGMLWIKGPNVMKGYLGREDLTRESLRDGWYNTGDVAVIDRDGFIRITGRVSRFSKIAGEMVPHIQVEEEINRFLGAAEDGEMKAAVTAVPDEKKGERLIVVHVPIGRSPAEVQQALSQAGLPNLYIPSPDSFVETDKLPILGSGKLDLKAVHEIAKRRFGNPS
jgi:acyl-[acyl-carrier-protein]-phospholipid O-acyltransferase/long-chain-fatty-acid--[acyl-carrier-protein] ligase